jgi:hypothetical protein
MEIRSYRRVFDLERRIYRVDRLRLNPGGVPVRGVLYFLAMLLVALVVGRLALIGGLVRVLPWYLRDLLLPVASAAVLSIVRVEGRPFHLAAHALLRYQVGPGRPSCIGRRAAPAGRWRPEEILILPDGSDAKIRPLRYTGPGAVLIAVEHERRAGGGRGRAGGLGWSGRRPAVIVRELSDAAPLPRAQVIALAADARLLVRSAPAAR